MYIISAFGEIEQISMAALSDKDRQRLKNIGNLFETRAEAIAARNKIQLCLQS